MFRKETRSVDLWDDWKSFVPRGSQKWSRMIDPWNGQFIESLSLMHYLLTTKDRRIRAVWVHRTGRVYELEHVFNWDNVDEWNILLLYQ